MIKTIFKKEQIPNIISVFRILLVPLYVLLFFRIFPIEADQALIAAGIVFILAGVSDLADGYLARRFGWITDIGKLLDPLADKCLETAVAVCLAIRFGGPFIILCAFVITKEIAMIIGAYLIMSKSRVYVSAVWCGKAATLVWYALILLVHFFPRVAEGDALLCYILCIVLILVMLMAFLIYVFNDAAQIETTKDVSMQNNQNKKKTKS